MRIKLKIAPIAAHDLFTCKTEDDIKTANVYQDVLECVNADGETSIASLIDKFGFSSSYYSKTLVYLRNKGIIELGGDHEISKY